MASEKNAALSYLTEKKAGIWSGLGRGITEAIGKGGGEAAQQAFQFAKKPGMGGLGEMMAAHAGRGATNAIGAAAVTGGVALAALGVHKLYDAATKTRDFNSMLEYSPALADAHAKDPKKVNQMFSTLRMMNPDFTRDPVVSSNYVLRMVDNPEGAGGLATEALDRRDKMKHPYSTPVLQAAFSGARGGGGGGGGEKKSRTK